MDALVPKVVNGYEFYEQVGTGGFGIVYRALQPTLGRTVAIKVILPEHANQPEFARRFEQEAHLIAHLEHPHIVPLYDYWQDASGAYLVMRWLPETVRQRIQQAPFSLSAAADLLDQVAGALQVAHQSGVIHRDLKPENLLLDQQNNTYLADFGIAKVIHSSIITRSGQLLGSMAYLAPEQINDLELTPQSDLYSLGLVLYEILTGIQPFAGSSASALLQHHLHDPLPSLHTQRPDLPSALDAVLAAATAKNPADRYKDVIRFARAFRAALPTPRHFQSLADPLTDRELEVLRLLADGLNNNEIAERLYVSLSTVKWYKKQIYSKLDAHSRETAIASARALGLLPANDRTPEQPTSQTALDRASAMMANAPSVLLPRLPTQTTPFIGREAEVAALMSLIRDPANRLISLLAPGGMGKSRLALEVAARIGAEFQQGAAFIALSAISAPEQMISVVASVVGVTLSGQIDPKQQLLEHFRRRQVLLIFDNFEHLLEAAPLLLDILEAAPQVKVLTTTRERLNLSTETVFPLGGLDVPEPQTADNLLAFGAIRLFVGAARRATLAVEYTADDLIQIGRICRLVQGMPLAILLAASWAELLKVGEIAEEVSRGIDFLESQWRDLPERQRSIRAVFETSWRRLTPTEAEALAKLSVFLGGFTRRAAEQVAGASLRTLSGLVNKALLSMDPDGRCSMHELLRQYAAEQLETEDSGDAVRRAHSIYYLESLAVRESDLIGTNHIVTMNDIKADLENVREALLWAVGHQDYSRQAAAVHPLWIYFFYGGDYADGSALFAGLAAALRIDTPTPLRDSLLADLLPHQAYLLVSMFERARADQCLAEAEPLVEASGNVRIRAFYHLTRSGSLPWEDLSKTIEAARISLSLYRSLSDVWGEAFAWWAIGSMQLWAEPPSIDKARAAVAKALLMSEALGDMFQYARALNTTANLYKVEGRSVFERLALLEQVLAIRRTLKNAPLLAWALISLACVKAEIGKLTDALTDGEEALVIKRHQGSVHDTVGLDGLGEDYFRMGRLAEARPVFEEALSYVRDTEQYTWRNIYRLYLLELDYAEGEYAHAERVASDMVRENTGELSKEHHHQMTYVLGIAGLAALARGDLTAVRNWYAQAEHSAETDPNRNGAMFIQIALGLLALAESDSSAALARFEAALAYFQQDYVYDLSQGWERDLALALALTGCSRAAVRLGFIERAIGYVRDALRHAHTLNIDAFALMALIPAAEIALANGDLKHEARLAALVADHPHTFAFDRAQAAALLLQLPNELRPSQLPDLWQAAAEVTGSS